MKHVARVLPLMVALSAGAAQAQGNQGRVPVTKDGKAPLGQGEAAPPEPKLTAAQVEAAKAQAADVLAEAAETGDAAAAAGALETLLRTREVEEVLEGKLRAGLSHLERREFAKAERMFEAAKTTAPDSDLAVLGLKVSSTARNAAEEAALEAIRSPTADPRDAARVLAAGLLVDASSPRVEKALNVLQTRAEKTHTTAELSVLANDLIALGALENVGGDMQQRLGEAAKLLSEGKLAEAQASFKDARTGVLGDSKSQVAGWSEAWVRGRRIAELEDRLRAVSKTGDVISESTVVQTLLDLDPDNRIAKSRSRDLRGRVVAARVEAAESHLDKGELGPAFIYLKKGLEVAPQHKRMSAMLANTKEKLSERSDFIMVVGAVRLGEEVAGEACAQFSPVLQTRMMENASQRDDLGGYVLSAAWTEAWKSGDDRVPGVEGQIDLVVDACSVSAAEGATKVSWSVRAPKTSEGGLVAEGSVEVAVDGTVVPKDEQDAAGNGARRFLAERASERVAEMISRARDAMDQWLLRMASYYVQANEPAKAADAYARLLLDKPISMDDEQFAAVEGALLETYR